MSTDVSNGAAIEAAIDAAEVTLPGDGTTLRAHLARPAGDGPYPAIVVIHEIVGLNDNIRDIAERFAAEGYVALAVDLFAGRSRALCMARFMSGLLWNSLQHQGIRDLRRTLDWLAARPEVAGDRVGAIGFCMGGSFAIAWAAGDDRLKAVAPFYAQNPRPFTAVERLCPVVGSYPERDFTAAAGRRLDQALDVAEVPHDIEVYPGAKHSFFNDQNPRSHDAAASEDAWRRTLAYFERYLRPGTG
ncbi:MAG: dienelactone hydrolase family protein [Deinococcales bacterium]